MGPARESMNTYEGACVRKEAGVDVVAGEDGHLGAHEGVDLYADQLIANVGPLFCKISATAHHSGQCCTRCSTCRCCARCFAFLEASVVSSCVYPGGGSWRQQRVRQRERRR